MDVALSIWACSERLLPCGPQCLMIYHKGAGQVIDAINISARLSFLVRSAYVGCSHITQSACFMLVWGGGGGGGSSPRYHRPVWSSTNSLGQSDTDRKINIEISAPHKPSLSASFINILSSSNLWSSMNINWSPGSDRALPYIIVANRDHLASRGRYNCKHKIK